MMGICLLLALCSPWFTNEITWSIWLPFRERIQWALSIPTQPRGDNRVFWPSRKCTDGFENSTRNEDIIQELSHFQNSLAQVVSLLPDDDTWIEMLRLVEGTGDERLRGLSLRTRAYQTYFQAWENLHIVQCGKDLYSGDDVLQNLRASNISQEDQVQSVQAYQAYRYFLAHLAELLFPWTSPYFADHMTLHLQNSKGRGIVYTASDLYVSHLVISIQTLRYLNCTLPIEVMYFGDQDLTPESRKRLEQLPNVITLDMSYMVRNDDFRLAGWGLKPFALLLSSFREAILIDADAYFLRNPESLFSDSSFLRTGALFFFDRLAAPKQDKKAWLQRILPEPVSKSVQRNRFWTGESKHMQESGVVVIDKWRHMVALLLVCRLNGPERDDAIEFNNLNKLVHGMSPPSLLKYITDLQ